MHQETKLAQDASGTAFRQKSIAVSLVVIGMAALYYFARALELGQSSAALPGDALPLVIGTVIFMALEHVVAAINPFHWMTLVGAVLIAIVLFAPRGLSGTLDELARLLTRDRWRAGR